MEQEKKLLLLGPGGAGKTCMRSIIFENYLPRDTLRLGITISMDESRVHILRNLFLNLLDGGGQQKYVLKYLTKQQEYVFRNVAVMLFVFDICSFSEQEPDGTKVVGSQSAGNWTKNDMLQYFRNSMSLICQHSPHAKVFVLLHKIDLIHESLRQKIFQERKADILQAVQNVHAGDGDGGDESSSVVSNIQFFCTSMWTDSLFRAFSSVVRSLIPNRVKLTQVIQSVGIACRAAEVALYERSTFLCLGHVTRCTEPDHPHTDDPHKAQPGDGNERSSFEFRPSEGELRTTQVSEMVKHFKLSCMNNTTTLDGFTIETANFTAILSTFTEYVHILVVCDDPSISVELHRINIDAARNRFRSFLYSDDPAAAAMREVL